MIVISGALVLVALVLLVIGLIDPSLGFVYASIAVSLASFVFLVVGILQRRKEVLPEPATAGAELPAPAAASEGITAIIPATPAATSEPAPAAAADQREDVSGQVLVVAGRPRYHVAGCRYLTGKDAESVDVADAREEGFTACGVCKPDVALAAAAQAEPVAEPAAAVPAPEVEAAAEAEPAATELPAQVDEVVETPDAPAAPARVAKATKKAAPAKAAVAKAAAKAPAKAPAKKAAAATATKAPAKASPAKKAAAPAVKRGGVIVIPDRGKFHAPECRYVRGAEGTLELSKAQATKQGYTACGVCNP